MDTGLLVFDLTHLAGECATHPQVLHSARQAALLRLAGNQPAVLSRLA
ncbi:MAG: hypothetical protein ACK5ME_04610 [Parahaliea sp.]